MSNVHDTDALVSFELEVSLPRHEAAALAEAMTGNDDDAILAAEKALRRAIEYRLDDDRLSQAELATDPGVREMIQDEAATEKRCQAIYGPVS